MHSKVFKKGDKIFSCEKCEEKFDFAYKLKNHTLKIHTARSKKNCPILYGFYLKYYCECCFSWLLEMIKKSQIEFDLGSSLI